VCHGRNLSGVIAGYSPTGRPGFPLSPAGHDSEADRRSRCSRAPVVPPVERHTILPPHCLDLALRLLQLRAMDDGAAGNTMAAAALQQPDDEGDTSEETIP